MPKFLTTLEAASRLALAPETLDTWRCRGGGPEFVKLGRSVRYSEDALNEFISQRTVRSTGNQQFLGASA